MKKLAARDFEDLLQCSIPAFEDLLDEPHNKQVMGLLYRTAEWHALAKSRMHTDSTLEHLRRLTKEFGRLMRQFRDQTCSKFDTVELPCEVAAQSRRHHGGPTKISSKGPKRDAPGGPSSASSHKVVPSPNTTSSHEGETAQATSLSIPSSRKLRIMNLLTTKFHFLGDYVWTIQRFGCTDSFSTQIV
jgi:hypothetical protein